MRYTAIIITLIAMMAVACAAMDTRQGSLNERVRSLQVHHYADPYAPPVIVLGSDDQLVFEFDHLSDDREYLRYELVHCNADWQPSGMVDSEVLNGFNVGDIDSYEFSRSAYNHYVHYALAVPNADMMPKLSGNYLLRVYPENNPDDVWAQFRFMVSEQTAPIEGWVSSRTDVDYNERHQQLALKVDTERAQVVDPFNDLTIVVRQNGRDDNRAVITKPLRMEGRNIGVYEHLRQLVFPAGNEYRRFETVSTTYPGMHVEGIAFSEPYYNFILAVDEPRVDHMYLYDRTQAGRYTIREYNSDEGDIDADYGIVHFALQMPRIPNARVYIEGDITERKYDDVSQMRYNEAEGRYEKALLLKQGAYNYQYVVVPEGESTGYTLPIEGDKYQTVNEYEVAVYAHHPGDCYDRLIGVALIK